MLVIVNLGICLEVFSGVSLYCIEIINVLYVAGMSNPIYVFKNFLVVVVIYIYIYISGLVIWLVQSHTLAPTHVQIKLCVRWVAHANRFIESSLKPQFQFFHFQSFLAFIFSP